MLAKELFEDLKSADLLHKMKNPVPMTWAMKEHIKAAIP